MTASEAKILSNETISKFDPTLELNKIYSNISENAKKRGLTSIDYIISRLEKWQIEIIINKLRENGYSAVMSFDFGEIYCKELDSIIRIRWA